MPRPETTRTAAKWSGRGAGEAYARARFASERRAGRDPALVGALLERHAPPGGLGRVLDVPCGAGRLRAALEQRCATYVGLDASVEMLAVARGARTGALLRGDALRLPFADRSFDAVVCVRLLHHVRDEDTLAAIARELARVSADLVVASYWDAATFPAWRRRVGLRRDEGPEGRVAHPLALVERVFAAAGAPLVARRRSSPLFSQQAFAIGRRAP